MKAGGEMLKEMPFQTPQGTGFNCRIERCEPYCKRDMGSSTEMLWNSTVMASDGLSLAALVQTLLDETSLGK